MTASIGQPVRYRSATSRYQAATIAYVGSGDTCTLNVQSDGSDWEDSVSAAFLVRQFTSIAKGTDVGTWQDDPVPDGYATTSYVDSEIAGIPAPDTSGLQAVPGAASVVSLALNTPRNPSSARSDSRPTRVTVSGGWSWTLTALGTCTGSLSLKVDTSNPPATTVVTLPFSRGISVGVTIGDSGTVPYCVAFEVPAGCYYEVVTSAAGGGSFGSPLVVEQAI